MTPPRVAFYCHNVLGLGHIARSVKLARATMRAGARCLIVTGCRVLDRLDLPGDVELVRLPALVMTPQGSYESADPSQPARDVVLERGRQIVDGCRAWSPDVMVVDHSPLGFGGELVPLLEAACAEAWPTRFEWGLPYAEGLNPWVKPPANPKLHAAMASYRAAIAYVPPGQEFFDRVPAWMLPQRQIAVGFVSEEPLPPVAGPRNLIVVACGGGTTAIDLCRLALAARRQLPEGSRPPLRLVIGAMSDLETVRRSVADQDADVDTEWRADGELRDVIRDASAVISRAGYNSVALLMQTSLPIVLVPAAGGSQDQVIRAASVSGAPGVWVVSHDSDDAAAQLGRAMHQALQPAALGPRLVADGATRAAAWFIEEATRA